MTKEEGKELVEISNFAAKTFGEDDWLELGYSLGCSDLIKNHSRLLQSLRFGDDDYRGNAMEIFDQIANAEPENLDGIRRFLAVEHNFSQGRTIEFISTAHSEKPKKLIIFSPKVFTTPVQSVNEKLVAVMFPFALTKTFDAVKTACDALDLECKKGDDIWNDSTFIQDIFELIYTSHIVVADFSGRNPNVLYEVGIAHALGKSVVPIVQNLDDIPSDLKHHRALRYLPNTQGYEELTDKLKARLMTLAS